MTAAHNSNATAAAQNPFNSAITHTPNFNGGVGGPQ